jgi:hypothetical protein
MNLFLPFFPDFEETRGDARNGVVGEEKEEKQIEREGERERKRRRRRRKRRNDEDETWKLILFPGM